MSLADDKSQENYGHAVEVEDAGALNQCFDWAFRACQYMGIPLSAIRHGAARQIWDNPTADTLKYFDLVRNTPDYIPPPNSLAVFGTLVGPYGHVAWVLSGCDLTNLYTSDENWNGHSYVEKVNHKNYYGVTGFLVPKPQPTPPTTVDAPTVDNEGVVNGAQLRGHTEPNTSSAAQWYFDDNEHITLVAKTTGENVTDGPYAPSSVWYLAHGNDQNAANAGYPQVWVSDAFVRTTKTPANVVDYVTSQPVPPTPQVPAYSVKPPTGLWVLDVSYFQGDIDFAAVKAGGVDGVIIRAGHFGTSLGGGQYNTDTKFSFNQKAARDNGLLIGYYWYGYPSIDAAKEAGDFIASVGKLQDGESFWLDLEEIADGVDTKTWVGQFMVEVERLSGRTCHVYSYYDYVQNRVNLDGILTGARKLWLANYNNKPGVGMTNRLAVPIAHQYWNQGKVQGITGNVDLDNFFMDAVGFRNLALPIVQTNPVPPPEKPPGTSNDPVDTYSGFLSNVIRLFKQLFEAFRNVLTKGKEK